MGRLKNTLSRMKNKGYAGSVYGTEIVANSSIVMHQYGSEIHLAKDKYFANTGFISLPEILSRIITEYSSDNNCGGGFTQFKMFNVVIGKEIEEAVRIILIKHKLSN